MPVCSIHRTPGVPSHEGIFPPPCGGGSVDGDVLMRNRQIAVYVLGLGSPTFLPWPVASTSVLERSMVFHDN